MDADEAVRGAVDSVVVALQKAEVLGRTSVDWDRFYSQRERNRAQFEVPDTTITRSMAHLLYAIGASAQPGRLVGIGTYYGNAFSWLCAAGFGAHASYVGDAAVAVDINGEAIHVARRNFERSGYHNVSHAQRSGRDDLDMGPIDLLFLDAEDSTIGKLIYAELILRHYGSLARDSLVLLHDSQVPKFAAAFQAARSVLDSLPNASVIHADVPIDPCGLTIARVVRSGEGTS